MGAACYDEATAAGEDEQQAGDQSLVGVAVAVLPHDLHAYSSRRLIFVADTGMIVTNGLCHCLGCQGSFRSRYRHVWTPKEWHAHA